MGICLNRSSVKIVTGPAVMWVIVLLLLIKLVLFECSGVCLISVIVGGSSVVAAYISARRTKGDSFYSCMMSIVSRDRKGDQYKGSPHPQTFSIPWHVHHMLLPVDETCYSSGSFVISKSLEGFGTSITRDRR
jgi:hypothetical protein